MTTDEPGKRPAGEGDSRDDRDHPPGGTPPRLPPEVREARAFLAGHLPATRLVEAPSLARRAGRPVHLKLESELPTGSFKVRGALWALERRLRDGPVEEVVASSTGNHGAAVAWAAGRLGVPATIFLPAGANPVKRSRITGSGARIVPVEGDLADAWDAAGEHARREGAFFLNDATDPHLPAGPATLAVEALEREPALRTFVVPVGDTALIRGVAAAARALPDVGIVGVQAEGAPAYTLSWERGEPVPTERADTLAGGLATRRPVAENVAALRRLADDMVLVSDDEMLQAVRHLLLEEHVVAEPAGAAATAALLAGDVGEGPTCVLVTGANVTEEVLRAALG